MSKPDLSVAHYLALVDEVTRSDDGAHAAQILELVHGVADPNNIITIEVEKRLYSLTPDFQSHFNAYLTKLVAA